MANGKRVENIESKKYLFEFILLLYLYCVHAFVLFTDCNFAMEFFRLTICIL